MQPLDTAYGLFLLPIPSPSSSVPRSSILLRGVNLSSSAKYPPFPPDRHPTPAQSGPMRSERDASRARAAGWRTGVSPRAGWWDEAEQGGREGWFVGRPLEEEGADLHFRRLRMWGFTVIRWIVVWEALEHAGPGQYDEAYIDYTIRLLRKAKSHGFRVFISPHQDVFSRFTGGSGAPYWALIACGINPRRVHQTGAAVVHGQWAEEGWGGVEGIKAAKEGKIGGFPDMIWNSNTGRLASRHCFTLFWAGEEFAPGCEIDGQSIGPWLRGKYNAAYSHLAGRITEADGGDLLDTCLIGWDTMNEPDEGFISIPDLSNFPPSQQFRKGPSPTPIQAFQLASGQSVSDIEDADFGSLGLKKKGTVTMTPPDGQGVWLTTSEAEEAAKHWGWTWGSGWEFGDKGQQCLWAKHGVWDTHSGKVLRPDYFAKLQDGSEYDFLEQFWKPHYISFISAIRKHHPRAISFLNGPIFAEPPTLSQDVTQGRMALSSHFYEALSMMGKRRHLFGADAVGIQRGTKSIARSIKFGDKAIRSSLRDQFGELASDASKQDSVAGETAAQTYPTIIGETGVPWDMKSDNGLLGLAKGKVHRKAYEEPAKAMDQVLGGCDGSNALSYTLWAYEPLNSHEHGDGWNGEDLSLFSYSDLEGDDDLVAMDPPDLKSLVYLGSRGITAWCRPYPLETCGRIVALEFNMKTSLFDLTLEIPAAAKDSLVSAASETDNKAVGCTKIFLPYVHYVARHVPENPNMAMPRNRLLGDPHPLEHGSGRSVEWVKGQGEARVDLEIVEMSEGTLVVEGQWGRWSYAVGQDKGREVRLKVKAWRSG